MKYFDPQTNKQVPPPPEGQQQNPPLKVETYTQIQKTESDEDILSRSFLADAATIAYLYQAAVSSKNSHIYKLISDPKGGFNINNEPKEEFITFFPEAC